MGNDVKESESLSTGKCGERSKSPLGWAASLLRLVLGRASFVIGGTSLVLGRICLVLRGRRTGGFGFGGFTRLHPADCRTTALTLAKINKEALRARLG
jgi:hypothetical protein